MRLAVTTTRSLLGLIFVVYGVNYFVPLVALPPTSPEGQELIDAFAASGFFLPLLRITQLVAGVALLANRYVPLALVILAPVVLNIVLYDIVLDPAGLPMGILLLALQSFLGWAYCDDYEKILKP
jgi:putative oxidoreductase